MTDENFTLTWHSHANHFQDVLGNLLNTGESSDVTLVCDDQVKFKSHKFVLKACSPVFESILQESNELQSVIYLRGINQLELTVWEYLTYNEYIPIWNVFILIWNNSIPYRNEFILGLNNFFES